MHLHSDMDSDPFVSLDELLRKMPLYRWVLIIHIIYQQYGLNWGKVNILDFHCRLLPTLPDFPNRGRGGTHALRATIRCLGEAGE